MVAQSGPWRLGTGRFQSARSLSCSSTTHHASTVDSVSMEVSLFPSILSWDWFTNLFSRVFSISPGSSMSPSWTKSSWHFTPGKVRRCVRNYFNRRVRWVDRVADSSNKWLSKCWLNFKNILMLGREYPIFLSDRRSRKQRWGIAYDRCIVWVLSYLAGI